jgi:phosphoenolpyruvate phosphomutase / 2-hydroxyethylphosphonate cytidylyltransferase
MSIKDIIKEGKPVIALEAHNGLSALIVENSPFDAIWISSLTDSASKGLPDTELISMDSRLDTVRQIRQVSTKPIIYDGDTGGQVEQFPYWVARLEEAGVDAIIIEDKAFPKRNSLDENASHILEDVDVFSKKISAGKAVAKNVMIIARLESLIAKHNVYEAMSRAEMFLGAGADGIMIHSKESVNAVEVFEFAKMFKEKHPEVPLVCVPTTYNQFTNKELSELGFNIIIHANHLLRASLRAMQETADRLWADQRSKDLDDDIATVKAIFKITGYTS